MIFLVPGKGIDIDMKHVRVESDREDRRRQIVLARLAIDFACLRRPMVKIDFSTILDVDSEYEVQLSIVLRRSCNGNNTMNDNSSILERYELEFNNDVETLPFSFTFVDEEAFCNNRRDCTCVYTVEIIRVEVEGCDTVDEIEAKNSAINAIVQSC